MNSINMTNPEDKSAETTASKTVAEAATKNAVKSEFLERVLKIPVVHVAKEYSTAAYNQVKQMNRFTAAALSAAEMTVLYFAVTAKTFLEKVAPQVLAQLVDQIACCVLDTVEEKVPFFMKPPEQLVEDASELASSTVEMDYQKVEKIKSMSKSYSVQKANEALDVTEGLVNRYLPPAFGEEPKNEGSSVHEKATKLTSKIGPSVYGHGVKQIMTIDQLHQESVSELAYTEKELCKQRATYVAAKEEQHRLMHSLLKKQYLRESVSKSVPEKERAECAEK